MNAYNPNNKPVHGEKILLAMLPFWSAMIPPLGIACLKSFLQLHGYRVTTVDGNTDGQLRKSYDAYFAILEEVVPLEKRGNFFNIGHDILRNHMLGFLNHRHRDENRLLELVKTLAAHIYYCPIEHKYLERLNDVIRDFFNSLEKFFMDVLERENPTVLGLSVFKDTLPASIFAFRLAKAINKKIKTVMGGGIFSDLLAVGSPDLDRFLEKVPEVDHVIAGEGELLFLKLLQGRLPSNRRVYTLKDIPGDVFDIDLAPPPDFSDLNLLHYPAISTYASRSCPFQCGFCSETVHWGPYRKKKPAQIAGEMITLSQKHHYQLFLMCDSLLNPIISPMSEALNNEKHPVYWDGYLRIDSNVCDADKTFSWRKGGFYRARLGVESGSDRVLKMMNKRIDTTQVKAAVSTLANQGIKTTTMWVIGYPGETEADFQQTLDLVEELKDDIYEAECNAFWFYVNGQIESRRWAQKAFTLYPGFMDILPVNNWDLRVEPCREERYKRMNRFVAHCNRLNIPNPYSLREIYEADERWKHLHENAVPSIIEFQRSGPLIDENKHLIQRIAIDRIDGDDREGDFDF